MNTNFGKLENGKLIYAPKGLVIDGSLVINPKAEHYLAAGYKSVNAAYPADPAPTGYHYEADGWAETETTIARKWKVVADTVIPRKFSKLKIYAAISSLGGTRSVASETADTEVGPPVDSATTWAKVQAWLEGKTVSGMNGWLAFQLAQEISEDNPLFAAWSEEARVLLGLTPERFEDLLASCILEG